MTEAVLLVAHGTVDDLDELPAFLARIRRGHPAPPALVEELRRRYAAIGGASPLNAINRRLAEKVGRALGVTTRLANRLAAPLVADVVRDLAQGGVARIASVPLAQYSARVYAEPVRAAAKDAGVEARCAESWACEPALIDAYAAAAREAIDRGDASKTTLVMTAHSLPTAAIRAGDSYEREVRACAEAVGARVGHGDSLVAFQSQSPDAPANEWLGPDLAWAIDAARARGSTRVVFAPIGFLADHVEVLYDLDIEARQRVESVRMAYDRARSLNDDDALVAVIAGVARGLLA
jgi:ferrochelatase